MEGLDWQPMQLPLAAGLNQGVDSRAMQPPFLDVALDVQTDEQGGLQTRFPYAALGSDVFGGGSIATARRLVANGDELLLFDKDTLYSWNAQTSEWVPKATHLAVTIEESPSFATTGDQLDCDRAELAGVIVYTWTIGGGCMVAAVDKDTGSVVCPPTEVIDAVSRCKLVALDTAILLFYVDGDPALRVYALDPTDVAAGISAGAETVLAAPDFNAYYDATKVIGFDKAVVVARRSTTTSYTIATVDADQTVSASTKARTCTGPIAVASSFDAGALTTHFQVVRSNAANIVGDFIALSSLTDVTVNQAIGDTDSLTVQPFDQITAAYRSATDSGQYRCYVWWTADEDTANFDWLLKYNYVDTGGTIGTQDTFKRILGLASRAFSYDGHVYFWSVFAGESASFTSFSALFRAQLQNTYFLYRDDGLLVAKAASLRAGGIRESVGFLPGVALTSGTTGFSWCGEERRIINVGGNEHTSYGARAPRDITFTFDSNEARRAARLGRTLYITGAEIMQYDGANLVECGFHVTPHHFAATSSAGVALTDGSYTYKMTNRWDNACGDVDRGSSVATITQTISGGPKKMILADKVPIHVTHKTGSAVEPALEVWRTPADPNEDSDFYLVTSKDPSVTSTPNQYLANDVTAESVAVLDDSIDDDTLLTKEAFGENGGILENLAPPAASIIIANDTRLFLAGVAGDPDRVWYSKRRSYSQVAAFHDALIVNVPREGGAITALAFNNDTLVVFRETAIYELPNDGFDNVGQGQNYGPARTVSCDCGAINQESVISTEKGIVFKSSKGWYLLNRGWTLDYIGGGVVDYDSETPLSVQITRANSEFQIRIMSSERMLAFDYQANQWFEWTVSDGLDAAMWNSEHVYLTATGPKMQSTSYSSLTYGADIETAWIKLADLQGAGRVRRMLILGEYRSACSVRIRIAYNYDETFVDDKTWTVSPTTVGGPLQLKHGPKRQQCESIKVRITVLNAAGDAPPTGEALKLTGLGLEVGIKKGLWRRLPAAQTQ